MKSMIRMIMLLLTVARASAGELVLVTPERVTSQTIREWKGEGFSEVVLLLDETNAAVTKVAAERLEAVSMPYHYWIEVGRNARMAEAHPRWMASLGMHDDWQKVFPNATPPKAGEVAKAFPWVPINYKEAFDAHVARVKQLLESAPTNYAGVLLNHLQAGPSSCGCGNLQCRWATDYHVPATGTAIGDDAAARFLRAVQDTVGLDASGTRVTRPSSKPLIPVWTTECEDEDLPADKRPDRKTTGLCGTVGCAVGTCPKDFTKQWSHLVKEHKHPVALLAVHQEFARTNIAFAHGPEWIARAVEYLDETLPKNGGVRFPHEKLWLVIEGRTREEEAAARKVAARTGAAKVIVARARLDQSFEPRTIRP